MRSLRVFVKQGVKRIAAASLWQRVICWRASADQPRVALTFDDGPDPEWTVAVLDVLKQHAATATFFLQGNRVDARPDLAARIVADGHEIGNHGYDHKRNDVRNQASLGDAALTRQGIATRLFRPPGGEMGASGFLWLVRSGFTTVMWSVDAVDSMRQEGKWKGQAPDYSSVTAGDIVLMHDDNETCVRELPGLLDVLRHKGLATVTVSRLIGPD